MRLTLVIWLSLSLWLPFAMAVERDHAGATDPAPLENPVGPDEGAAGIARGGGEDSGHAMPWWGWPLLLFVVTFFLGIVAVMGGVGGGVLFVPVVGSLFPFHFDFVRGAGLLMAMAGSLAAGPRMLRSGMVNLRLAMPISLVASVSAIIGAQVGLALPTRIMQIALGGVILAVGGLMLVSRKAEFPKVMRSDAWAEFLGMHGCYHEATNDQDIVWRVHRTPLALVLFLVIGFLAGMFGLGAGWANVPALNLVMGAPLKVAVATSGFTIAITNTAAVWVYLNRGAIMAMIAVPSVLGIMLGAMIGARLLHVAKAASIHRLIVAILFLAGLRVLLKGLGVWE